MRRRSFLKSVAAGTGSLAFPAIAIGQQYKAEYKMSTVVPPAFAWGKGGEIFANIVRDKTGGRINIKQYPGSSLVQGDQTREFSAMRQGVIVEQQVEGVLRCEGGIVGPLLLISYIDIALQR